MRKIALGLGLAICASVLAEPGATTAFAQSAGPFTLTSPKLKDGGALDARYAGPDACGGQNVSLPLEWSNPPKGTESFAATLFDFDGGHGFGVAHWIAYGIDPATRALPEGAASKPSKLMIGGANMRKQPVYRGPCAPTTESPHHYIYTIYALSVPKDELPPGLTRDQFLGRVKGRVLMLTSLVATYRRPH